MGIGTAKPDAQRGDDEKKRQPDPQEQDQGRQAEEGDEALNDARALQQMIEGVPDSGEEFRRIEQKR